MWKLLILIMAATQPKAVELNVQVQAIEFQTESACQNAARFLAERNDRQGRFNVQTQCLKDGG